MNIGFISTWFERGAAYVTKAYIEALKDNNNIFVYARGGETFAQGDPAWDFPYVTWGLRLYGSKINFGHFKEWISKNNIEVLFFNEQRETKILGLIKREFPFLKIGSYVDYYQEHTVADFWLYDFLICNTKRHYSVFKDHPQCYYVPWGTDVTLFKPRQSEHSEITFFHSVGMSRRKGTDLLLGAYIDGEIYKDSKLTIHSQLNFEDVFGYKLDELKKFNIEIIQKTVGAPGLYYLGDVYVYPATLDGLGLTLYEALSSGLPVITTDNAPMNEVVNNEVGYLVAVERYTSRRDGYYWPLSICSKEALISGMRYYIENTRELLRFKNQARKYALESLDWKSRYSEINSIFTDSSILVGVIDPQKFIQKATKNKNKDILKLIYINSPDRIVHIIELLRKKIFSK